MTAARAESRRMDNKFFVEIKERIRGEVRENEPMAAHTSFGIGGPADVWAKPQTREDLIALIGMCEKKGFPYMIIGRGTNLLVRDGGIRGVVIDMEQACGNLEAHQAAVTAGSGVSLNAMAKAAARNGLRGLEFCAGIPGSVGGGLATNAGARGDSLCRKLKTAEVYDPERRKIRIVRNDEVDFSYRSSNLASFGLILGADFDLERDEPEAVSLRMREYLEQRSDSQPVGLKNAGCIFKNPPGGCAGALIDALGFKGRMRGGAMVSDVHANFIVNTGTATAADVLALMAEIKERALSASGIDLEEEIQVVGTD